MLVGVAVDFIVPEGPFWKSEVIQVAFPKEEEPTKEVLPTEEDMAAASASADAAAAAAAAASANAAFLPAFGPLFFFGGVCIVGGGVSIIVSRTGEQV